MIFLSVVIVFVILQAVKNIEPAQNDKWLQSLREISLSVLGENNHAYGVIIAPAFVLSLIVIWMSDWLFGLVGLTIYVFVLLYSLGRGDLAAALDRYLDAWQRGDKQADVYLSSDWGITLPQECDENEMHQIYRKRYLYLSFERWFAVLFWFVFFGPAGALFYRLARLEQDRGQPVYALVHFLEWIPVRLFGLACSIVGDFNSLMTVFRRDVLDTEISSETLCDDYVVAALGLDVSGLNENDLDMRGHGLIEWSEVKSLVHRCAIGWLVTIAIISMM